MKGPEESGSGEKWVKMFQHPANEAITKLVQLIADEAVRLRVEGLGIYFAAANLIRSYLASECSGPALNPKP